MEENFFPFGQARNDLDEFVVELARFNQAWLRA